MADAVTSQTIADGDRQVVMKFTNVSDGTGESAVTKVDVSALGADSRTGKACTSVTITRIMYSVSGVSLRILWAGTPNLRAWILGGAGDSSDDLDFSTFGGIPNNASSATGDVLFTTSGHTSGDSYTVGLIMTKNYG